MARFWASWWSGNYEDEGCTAPPFQVWVTGERDRANGDRSDQSICAVLDPIGIQPEADIWQAIKTHYPDAELRFCNPVADDWLPGDRFPDFENRTGIGFFTIQT